MKSKIFTGFLLLVYLKGFRSEQQKFFPKDFRFGVSTSAYQIEGAWNVSGKSESCWDYFTHTWPENVHDGTNGDVACDSYHKLGEDVKLMKNLGVHFYKFSVAWTRIIPSPFTNIVNQEGVDHYNKLINLVLDYGIEPIITLYHWDLPQSLQQPGGFASPVVIESFVKFAKVAFENFGDRVKKWLTFNEPYTFCMYGYGHTALAPGYNLSGIVDYVCSYHVLKAHAQVYHLYNNNFKRKQKGSVSIALSCEWYEPASNSKEDVEAAERSLQFVLGLFAHPTYTKAGDYPDVVKKHIAERSQAEGFLESRLPKFNKEEIRYIRGTSDFFALNHLTTYLVTNKDSNSIGTPSFRKDRGIYGFQDPSWPSSASPNNNVVPWGFTKILAWIKKQYRNPIIYVTENGFADTGSINDTERINYHKLYLNAALDAINNHNVRLKGYSICSLLDNFEWVGGYLLKYGLYHVDFADPNRTRTAKGSVEYYKQVIKTGRP